MSRILIRLGFRFKGQEGSHMKFTGAGKEGNKLTIIVPNHKTLNKSTLHNILKTASIKIVDLKMFL